MGKVFLFGRIFWAVVACAMCASAAHADDGAGVIPAPVNTGKAWIVYKKEWSAADEAGYAAFVQRIGRSRCTSLENCLASDANPYRDTDNTYFSGDCADMAYMLRAYYAWKNGLPFSYQSAMRTANGSGEDLRYSSAGNKVVGRRKILNSVSNAPGFIQRIGGEVSTAMFRTHPDTGGGASHDDFYPMRIGRDAVRPGAIAYDIYGHVGIVYDIMEDGRVLIVASHPDQSVTRTVYGSNFMRSKPELGAGIKGWRPITVVGATENADGSLSGGRLQAAKNEEIADFSMEQFFGNRPHPSGEWHYGEFEFEGRTLRYYDYVRRRLAAPGFAFDPISELRLGLQTICGAIKSRKVAVDKAILYKIHLEPHPNRLPPNIYGTYGEWEEYSTPSRDARLKVAFIELRREVERLYEGVTSGAPGLAYSGTNLEADLLAAFDEEKKACTVTYWRSDDETRMRLNLAHVMDRLFALSFDPYHCPERRWGATHGVELETCTDNENKQRWYNAQRFLRYQAERTYDIRMNFTLDELKPPMQATAAEGGLGVEKPADADILAYLWGLNSPAPFDPLVSFRDEGEFIPVSAPEEPFDFFPAWHSLER